MVLPGNSWASVVKSVLRKPETGGWGLGVKLESALLCHGRVTPVRAAGALGILGRHFAGSLAGRKIVEKTFRLGPPVAYDKAFLLTMHTFTNARVPRSLLAAKPPSSVRPDGAAKPSAAPLLGDLSDAQWATVTLRCDGSTLVEVVEGKPGSGASGSAATSRLGTDSAGTGSAGNGSAGPGTTGLDSAVEGSVTDLGGRLVLPAFLDAHTHLDKTHSWDRAPNLSGTFGEAITRLSDDKVHWSAEDVYRRAAYGLETAFAHGTGALRTHIDSGASFGAESYAAMAQLQDEWAGRVLLQTVSLSMISSYGDPNLEPFLDYATRRGGLLGGMPVMHPDLDAHLDRFFAIAAERGVGVDLHVDENQDASTECLRRVALAVLRHQFPYPVTCGHNCSLACQPYSRQRETLDLVAQAGIQIISLPLCNLYLQDRRAADSPIKTPFSRGITLIQEFLDAGVCTAVASDNVRDAFYAYGDYDMFEVLVTTNRLAHLDNRLPDLIAMTTAHPAHLMGLPDYGNLQPGSRAHFVVFEATQPSHWLSRPTVLRQLILGEKLLSPKVPAYPDFFRN